ncbi:MAG: sec-independent protein translocase protein TatA [Pseudonocardiales bacterium]|jgi:sec-independent protein translocase protein TatA|nr:sec-independent protein translocase protein TatA [Pseudonocardiales bacterium]MDT7623274.1 sec-independent protein translocase protein TatA [Pseudonocardiales bacterium]
MMPGGWEWVILLVVVVALFGAKRLPEMARSMGRSARVFRGELKGLSEDGEPTTPPTTPPTTVPKVAPPAALAPGPSATSAPAASGSSGGEPSGAGSSGGEPAASEPASGRPDRG